ncbi:phosphoglycerate mutase 5 isoform X1 [Tachypleus tridentatus]|uniref:phosphoglycerate mutase 5 isoform X1 n=1 Tax=Tachypleus tridentatus TaxID=6853 RepID=UPI003FD082BA
MVGIFGRRLFFGIAGSGVSAGFLWGIFEEKPQTNTLLKNNPDLFVKWDFNWDRRDPHSLVKPPKNGDPLEQNRYNVQLVKATPKASRHLILIRHGQYIMANDDCNRKLTELGKEQADIAGKRIKNLGFPFTRIIQSSMLRALETSQMIQKHLEGVRVETCDLIREGAPIPPEPPVGHWRPEAQQFYQDGARIEAAFRKYFHRASPDQEKDSYDVLVCHANVIRYFVCRALQLPPEAWLRFSLHNCSISWIVIQPSGRVIAYTVGDIGHMPTDKMSTS